MTQNVNEQLVAFAIAEVPALLLRIKDLFHKSNPDAPQVSDEEVIAAYQGAFQASVDKDDRWLAAHPE